MIKGGFGQNHVIITKLVENAPYDWIGQEGRVELDISFKLFVGEHIGTDFFDFRWRTAMHSRQRD